MLISMASLSSSSATRMWDRAAITRSEFALFLSCGLEIQSGVQLSARGLSTATNISGGVVEVAGFSHGALPQSWNLVTSNLIVAIARVLVPQSRRLRWQLQLDPEAAAFAAFRFNAD